jgi:hypothetical protein
MMKQTIVTVAVALIALPAMGQAQQQVTATATVAQYSLVSGSGDLAFGTLSRTVNNVIDAEGGLGAATRSLEFNHNVTVTFTNVPAVLTDGTKELAVALTCTGRVGAGAWQAAAPCSSAEVELNVGTALTTGTLSFGGEITAANAANAVAGSYAGTLDIVVAPRGT